MHIELRRRGDILIADLSGRLVQGDAQQALRDALAEMLASEWNKIVFNVAGLARIDSSGFGELVACLRTADAAGASLALLQPDDKLRRILHVSQVLPLFPTFETEDDALAALRSDGGDTPDA